MLQGSVLYCMNAFMEPLCAAHGWSRAGINISMGIASLMGQFAMPLAAAVSTRCSLRRLTALGALAGGVSIALMGMTGDIRLFTLLSIVAWISTQICGGVVGNALVSNWFYHYRGRAFGLANAGATLTVALYVYAKEQGEFGVAFAIAAILMVMTLMINFAADMVSLRFRKKRQL